MNFEELRNKRKADLEKAIEEKDKLINYLQKEFDNIDKFKKGNFIVKDDNYYLIVGDPILQYDTLRLPIRHHIYPYYCCGDSFSLNASGAVDFIDAYLDKLPQIEVITIKELFEREKDKLKNDFNDQRENYVKEIRIENQKITAAERRIDQIQEAIKKHDSINIDSEFNTLVDNFIKNRFEELVKCPNQSGSLLYCEI